MGEEHTEFKQKRSTSHETMRFTQAAKEAFNQTESALAVFVDFKAAYNTIWGNTSFPKTQPGQGKRKHAAVAYKIPSQRWITVRYGYKSSGLKQTKTGTTSSSCVQHNTFQHLIQ